MNDDSDTGSGDGTAVGRAAADSYTGDQLQDWLLAGAVWQAPHQTAALRLLCEHGSWTLNRRFREVAVETRPDDGWACIDFDAALDALDAGELGHVSHSSQVILQAAAVLHRSGTVQAVGAVGWQHLDQSNCGLVLKAVAAAAGFRLDAALLRHV